MQSRQRMIRVRAWYHQKAPLVKNLALMVNPDIPLSMTMMLFYKSRGFVCTGNLVLIGLKGLIFCKK